MPKGKAAQSLAMAALVAISTLIGILLAEAGYRVWLGTQFPDRFVVAAPREMPPIGIFDKSYWEFDAALGYIYPPNRVINITSIVNGKVAGCPVSTAINALGNIGPIEGSYHDAALKIAVFGDSWAAFFQENMTWPLRLQQVLTERLGRNVHVLNFGRDGYGLLQMFDLAAQVLPQWKPDLALFTFISDDIDRERFWRTSSVIEGELRILTTTEPTPNPSMDRAADTMLIHPEATHEWCLATMGSRDRIVEEIEARYQRATAWADPTWNPTPSLYTLKHSYIYNLLIYRDPFYFTLRRYKPQQNPRIKHRNYANDSQFMEKLQAVNASGVRWELIHLAHYPEVAKGEEYILMRHTEALLESLEKATGKTAIKTLDYVELPVEQPERMNFSKDNFHPSRWGMDFYANVVADMLVHNAAIRLPAKDKQ